MITIDQLLKSVDLDFEPRWVAKDKDGDVYVWANKPELSKYGSNIWVCAGRHADFGKLKLSEFDGKDWTECIYEVPRKTTGKIEKAEGYTTDKILAKVNELVDAVNELKERTQPTKLTGFAKTLSDLDMSKPMSSYTNKGE